MDELPLICLLCPRNLSLSVGVAVSPRGKHQAHSKSRPNYGQMRGSSLCLRTKPEVTQLIFKGSHGWRVVGCVCVGGASVGRGGDQVVINIYLVSYWKGKCAVCLSSTHPGGGPGGCKTSRQGEREQERERERATCLD